MRCQSVFSAISRTRSRCRLSARPPEPLIPVHCPHFSIPLSRLASTLDPAMSRPSILLPISTSATSQRGRMQCPICAVHIPAARTAQHAAVCGVAEEKQQASVSSEVGSAARSSGGDSVDERQGMRGKRKRSSLSPQHSRADEGARKQTARDRARGQRKEAVGAGGAAEEKDSVEQQGAWQPRPLAFINSPPAVQQMVTPTSRIHTLTSELTTKSTTTTVRRRIERGVITTYPPSSPVLGYSSDDTPGGSISGPSSSQLKINIPSPSPPPLSPAQYPPFSPRHTAPSSAPSWLSYRVAAKPPTKRLGGPGERAGALRFLTYNVWFDDAHQRTRTEALASLIAQLQPDVVALQEVTPSVLSLLHKSEAVQRYYMSPAPTSAPYFTLLLTRRQPVTMYRVPFVSQMGRDLTVAVLDVPAGEAGVGQRLIVSTSHLESLWQSKERRAQQLKQTLSTLTAMAAYPHSSSSASTSALRSSSSSPAASLPALTSLFFLGDTNLRANECAPLIAAQHFTDLYPTLVSTHASNTAAGYTYDTTVNAMIASRGGKSGSRARYDRVLGKVGEGLEVTGMWRAGMEPIADGVWISDHFGLVTELKL